MPSVRRSILTPTAQALIGVEEIWALGAVAVAISNPVAEMVAIRMVSGMRQSLTKLEVWWVRMARRRSDAGPTHWVLRQMVSIMKRAKRRWMMLTRRLALLPYSDLIPHRTSPCED